MLSASGTGAGLDHNVALAPAPSSLAPGKATPDSKPPAPGRSYVISHSDFNYSSDVLNGPLATYVGATGPGSGGDASVDPAVVRCVTKISERVGKRLNSQAAAKPIGVDQALYQGNEAMVMAFWKDRLRNAVWVYVVDSNCANVRQPAVGRWQ